LILPDDPGTISKYLFKQAINYGITPEKPQGYNILRSAKNRLIKLVSFHVLDLLD
jgi:hypothetical protein